MSDMRITQEADLQKLVHCEVLKVEQTVMNGTICFGFVLRSFDETIFQFYLMPGLDTVQVGNSSYIRPAMTIVTKEVVEDGQVR